MSRALISPITTVLRDALTIDVDSAPADDTVQLTRFLVRAFGPSAAAIIHYGSHAQHSGARPESAHDFFVIVDRYSEAYRSLKAAVGTHFRPTTAALLNHLLAPNVVAVHSPGGVNTPGAKCAVLSRRDFARACSSRAADHFTLGRMFQQVQLVWARDQVAREAVLDALAAARVYTFTWGRPYLPPRFDAATYCEALLRTSFAAEIRPEGSDRLVEIFEAQRDTLTQVYDTLLQHLAQQRILAMDGNVYSDPHPPTAPTRLAIALYFRRSKLRATLRWLKYVALYDGWLEYLQRKVARRSGTSVELTARERRWPLVFLWPKAIHYLRRRPQRRIPPSPPAPRTPR